jgi:N-acetylglucosaminyl-diphospho-decaprenol L-rhamnosyltransferase
MPGVVIVTYNSADVVQECIEGCLKLDGASIVVVDNASQDDTLKRIADCDVQVIANDRNAGFGAAVNQGFRALAREEAILILNPDATPVSGIDKLTCAVSEGDVAAATGRLLDSSGLDQHGFNVRSFPTAWTLAFEVLGINRLWPRNPVNRRYRQNAPSGGGEIEQPAGAFLMVRRSAWAAIGGFDENFFPIWFEDVDFCKRLRESGYRLRFVPEAIARHQGGHSASALPWGERQLFWYGSLLKYASKHFSAGSRRVVALAVMLACLPRMIAGMFQLGISEPVSIYSRVVWLAGQYLRQGDRRSKSPG